MAKRIKFLDVNAGGAHLEGVYFPAENNPYRIFLVWRDYGLHKAQIVKYADFLSCVYFLRDFFLNGLNKMSSPEIKAWIDERTI